MKLSKALFLGLIVAFGCNQKVNAQYDGIDKGYYSFPIQPDKVNFLSGTMGELRATHFHAGLDIKTNGKEGLNVYAAADGYISRIRVSTGGYGNSVYIQHPNGTSTVYAHLQRFNDILGDFVLANQYKKESFEVNLFPQRNQFRVKKGEVIGLSGNSGSSSGPHLHFEIRNSKQEVLDPLRIGFDQIRDGIPPIPMRIALKTMDIDSRVNGQFGRFEFNLERRGNEFVITDTISAFGKIGIEIWAHDKLDGATNRNGIPIVKVFQNRNVIFSQNIEKVSFSMQKAILVHTNYKAQKLTRRRYNKLYVDDGNALDFYDSKRGSGVLEISEESSDDITIQMIDAYDNQRLVHFKVIGEALTDKIQGVVHAHDSPQIQDNTLKIVRPSEDSDLENITIYTKAHSAVIGPSYSSSNEHVYLWDLRKGLPDSVVVGQHTMDISFNSLVPPNKAHSYLDDTYALKFQKNSLFDTLYLNSRHYVQGDQEILQIGSDLQPLKGGFNAEFQPLMEYDSLEQYHVFSINDSGDPGFVGGQWENGVIKFSVNSLGKFTLMKDLVPPSIRTLSKTADRLSFRIEDKTSGIKEFRAEIDGKWLLMNYDSKRNLIWSKKLKDTQKLQGDFSLKVLDNAGNESILNLKL